MSSCVTAKLPRQAVLFQIRVSSFLDTFSVDVKNQKKKGNIKVSTHRKKFTYNVINLTRTRAWVERGLCGRVFHILDLQGRQGFKFIFVTWCALYFLLTFV
uniref:Uncharacterized protein n=1 Tax=Cacopsylla melanoneura TaxID=428564 RepID=A0A8D9EIN2_9HEMI